MITVQVAGQPVRIQATRKTNGAVDRIVLGADTDPIRGGVVRAVDAWLARDIPLQEQALRCQAMAELIAGLIRNGGDDE
jgi:hypothetical protein